jgi:hypothetical protein
MNKEKNKIKIISVASRIECRIVFLFVKMLIINI